MEGGENEVIAREEYLVLRTDNNNIIKASCSENERIGKVKINACVMMENEHESMSHLRLNSTWNSLSENRE